jgi:hypothetical protein
MAESVGGQGKAAGAPAKNAAPKTAAAPKTTGSVNPARSQKVAASASDPVGDICLLPDIAGFAH